MSTLLNSIDLEYIIFNLNRKEIFTSKLTQQKVSHKELNDFYTTTYLKLSSLLKHEDDSLREVLVRHILRGYDNNMISVLNDLKQIQKN